MQKRSWMSINIQTMTPRILKIENWLIVNKEQDTRHDPEPSRSYPRIHFVHSDWSDPF